MQRKKLINSSTKGESMTKESLDDFLFGARLVGGVVLGATLGGLIAGHGTNEVIRLYMTESMPIVRYAMDSVAAVGGAGLGGVMGLLGAMYIPQVFSKEDDE